MFEDVFKFRLEGSGAKISRTMEACFLEDPKTPAEKRIAKYILQFREQEVTESEKELFTQKKRLADAERTLKTKVTKKAQNDQRIATDKIEKLKYKIERLNSNKLSESDSRIYPGQYAPLVFEKDGERWVAPFRYLIRPNGESPEFDKKFNGAYNMRRDSLDRVFWWKNLFGKHHGFMEISAFWENVERHGRNAIIKFSPDGDYPLIVPCIFDFNKKGEFPLSSFALITDEPNPEVKAAGHDRTPIFLKEENLQMWLDTSKKDNSRFEKVFDEKQPTYFEHEVAA